ncbi:hypothetical protein [Pseudosulfitobacter pseudonitzschiae]|nr:hypothetical protein [Pseudosulfitobacter pseudonitzschiae]
MNTSLRMAAMLMCKVHYCAVGTRRFSRFFNGPRKNTIILVGYPA